LPSGSTSHSGAPRQDREAGASPNAGCNLDIMPEHAGKTPHDPQSQAEAPPAIVASTKILKDLADLSFGYPGPGIDHVSPNPVSVPPCSDQDPAFACMLDSISHQV
jgi:hypothetical protein